MEPIDLEDKKTDRPEQKEVVKLKSVVVPFRPFKIPGIVDTQFFQSTSKANEDFMLKDLALSGLTPEDMLAYVHPMMKLKEGAQAGYGIPYFNVDGTPISNDRGELVFHRTKLKYPEFHKGQRYDQPHAEQLARSNLPTFLPYIQPRTLTNDGEYLVCCEGEKKTAAVLKYLELPAFGIGGASMWGDPNRTGGIHPWIRRLAEKRGATKFLIIPDGDVYRYDICAAYGTFANALINAGFEVDIVSCPGKIDDLLVGEWRDDPKKHFAALKRIAPSELVQSPSSLIQRYSLAFKQDAKGNKVVHQHSSNITKLMKEHPAFPPVWRNLDTNELMIKDAEARPDHSEMEIANYFQHHLGMDKVRKADIIQVMQYLGRENERSPFLDWVKNIKWDGVPRLDTWMIDYWKIKDNPFTREVSNKWLIGACARMAEPGTKIDWMMIVVGKQGTGKTSMPNVVFKGHYNPLSGDHSDKDLYLNLHRHLCTGFDELDSFNKRDAGFLKSMISKPSDSFRPPYGALVEVHKRRFTLYGCGNRYEFLQNDPSGYRRYPILEANELLDFKGLEAVVPQLWAEAWERYRAGGVKYWEVEGASENAEKHTIASPMEESIRAFLGEKGFEAKHAAGGVLYFMMSQLTEYLGLGKLGGASNVVKDIGAVLQGMGIKKSEYAIPHPADPKKPKQKYYIYNPEES